MCVSTDFHRVIFSPVQTKFNPATALARQVVMPVRGRVRRSHADVWRQTKKLIVCRYKWLDGLFDAGLDLSDVAKPYLYNCPPCTHVVRPIRCTCNYRMCPWCWGRKAIKVFDKLLLRLPMQCVLVKHQSGVTDISLRVDPVDPAGQLREVFQREKRKRDDMQRLLKSLGAMGVYYRLTIAPPYHKGDVMWRVQHRALAAVSDPADVVGHLAACECRAGSYASNKKEVRRAVAYLLQYPRGWLSGEPALSLAVWDTFKTQPCCTASGIFRQSSSH